MNMGLNCWLWRGLERVSGGVTQQPCDNALLLLLRTVQLCAISVLSYRYIFSVARAWQKHLLYLPHPYSPHRHKHAAQQHPSRTTTQEGGRDLPLPACFRVFLCTFWVLISLSGVVKVPRTGAFAFDVLVSQIPITQLVMACAAWFFLLFPVCVV